MESGTGSTSDTEASMATTPHPVLHNPANSAQVDQQAIRQTIIQTIMQNIPNISRMRRPPVNKCYYCGTRDTAYWRRTTLGDNSILLCNKCGLICKKIFKVNN
ncbi:hypothetical protein ACTA71_009348 [Dictyostelium dimigraforme]